MLPRASEVAQTFVISVATPVRLACQQRNTMQNVEDNKMEGSQSSTGAMLVVPDASHQDGGNIRCSALKLQGVVQKSAAAVRTLFGSLTPAKAPDAKSQDKGTEEAEEVEEEAEVEANSSEEAEAKPCADAQDSKSEGAGEANAEETCTL